MVRLIFIELFILLLTELPSYSQEFQLSSFSGTFTPITNGILVPEIITDDGASEIIDIGFNFTYFNDTYNQLVATSNGILHFELSETEYSFPGNNLSFYQYGFSAIAPLWDDLSGEPGQASYKMEGASPNRVFTFEWLNWKWDYSVSSPTISFQVKLYETSNKIEFIYRQESGELNSDSESFGASIGLIIANYGAYTLNNSSTSPVLDFYQEEISFPDFLSTDQSLQNNSISLKGHIGIPEDIIYTRPAIGQIYQFIYRVIPEPSNHVTSFTATNSGKAVNLNWIDASGETTPKGYLILASTNNSFTTPEDGIEVVDDLDLTDGSGCVTVKQGIQSFSGFALPDFNQTCYFAIYPYTNSGNNINYKTDGIIPKTSVTSIPKPEPTNQAGNFNVNSGASKMVLTWSDATGDIIPDGYLVIVSKTGSFINPADGD
jgi:hypothetical protein